MASIVEGESSGRRQGRRWRFGDAMLDEARWTLSVDGARVQIETKPLELLHELLLHAGEVVTKGELLDAIWPGVSVVEASLPTAVNKLRRALGDEKRGSRIIETVPRLGYRLAVSVEVEPSQLDSTSVKPEAVLSNNHDRPTGTFARRWPVIAGGLAVALTAGAVALASMPHPPPAPLFTQQDAADAIRKLDVERIEALLRAGWNPNTPFDDQGNGAMTFVLNICEWDPGHDRARLLLMARTLLDGGARIDSRNKWGDTPYSIAKARRYCGPDHPVTKMIRVQCNTGLNLPSDRCLATYELARRKPVVKPGANRTSR